MEITILIGNGFDLNLGLNTTYKDFLIGYLKKNDIEENIYQFKKDIKKELDSWAIAELKFGQYTSNYKIGEKEEFMQCHDDFIDSLADYLIIESEKMDISDENSKKFGYDFQNIYQGLTTEEYKNVKSIFDKHAASAYVFNFLIFNYTQFIKEFKTSTSIEYIKHSYKTSILTNRIGEIRHIHGTVLRDMSLGLNDVSQIANIELFEGDNSDIDQLVKPLNNKAFGQLNDNFGYEMLRRSSVYYVYGMSLGETDKIWWERIGEFLSEDVNKRLIIHTFPEKRNQRLSRHTSKMKANCKHKFMGYQKDEIARKISADTQIIVTDGNLFKSLSGLSQKESCLSENSKD